MIRLFDIENNVVIPTEHCHTIKAFKDVFDEFPDPKVHLKVFQYIFYMSCHSQENPFYNIDENDKADIIAEDIGLNFSVENDVVIKALERARLLYETPTLRAYLGLKQMIDNLAAYMATTKITHGRDGNISSLVQAAKNLQGIRESFKGLSMDLAAEQETKVRGNKTLGYDQQ